MLILLVLLNFGISWLNAWSVGKSWTEAKAVGGWPRFMAWMGATMAACGFTWCFSVLLAVLGVATGKLPTRYGEAVLAMGYLVIILPVLGSGLAITVQTWAHFWRKKTFGGALHVGWNTFAQVYNTVQAFDAIPEAFGIVADVFKPKKGEKSDGMLLVLAVVLVILAVAGGILLTATIIRRTARNHAFDVQAKMAA